MVEISASLVKELRDQSGAAMMECKKALVEASGDKEKAMELLRQRGIASASKKASRSTSEGLVAAAVSSDLKSGVIVEINCETDFVARNEEFQALTKELAEVALNTKSKDVESLLKQKHAAGTIQDYVTEKVAKTGENMVVRRLQYLELSGPGAIGLYIHALGGKMGALVQVSSNKDLPANDDVQSFLRDLAMHIVSAKPQFVSRQEIPAEVIENERRIESGKEDLAKKPPEIREKMVQGRLDKILAERCLVDQPFVKDPNTTVAQFLKQKGQALGAELTPVKFAMFILGETSGDGESSNGNGASA